MKLYKVVVHKRVYEQIASIQEYIASINTYASAIRYSNALFDEIETLSYLADVLPETDWTSVKEYHPDAKRMVTHNRKWNIIFHVEGDFVIIDSILASSTMKQMNYDY